MSDEVEIVKAGVQATVQGVFAPFNQLITNLLGPVTEEIGVDWRNRYVVYRTARTARLLARVQEVFDAREVQPHPIPPKLLASVLENGSVEEDDSLQDRWAALLINGGPGREEKQLLNSAPEILKQINKWEAMLLERCMFALKPEDYMPLPIPAVRSQLNTIDEWAMDLRNNHGFDCSGRRWSIDTGIMIQNLVRLRLLKTREENGKEIDIFLTTLGYHFLLLCSYPKPGPQEPTPLVKSRVYLIRWTFKNEGEGEVQYHFSMTAQGAATWERREDAEAYVRKINEEDATFSSADKQYSIANPVIEKREDGKFVVSCEI